MDGYTLFFIVLKLLNPVTGKEEMVPNGFNRFYIPEADLEVRQTPV